MTSESDGPESSTETDPTVDHEVVPTPWSFKIMVVLLAIYLLYRSWQGVVWLIERIS